MAQRATLTITLAGGYPFAQLERLLRAVDPLAKLEARRQLILDLRGMTFIGPAGLAWLIAVVRRAEDHNLIDGGSVLMPRSPLTQRYLMRMDFLTTLDLASVDDEQFERHPAVGFRPCQRFLDDEGGRQVALEMTDALAESCETDDLARHSLRICLDELAENVIFHADTPLGGFVVAQRLKRIPEFEIGIADLGVGIRRSLQKNPAYVDISDDVTAISKALQPRVTSTPERNGGFGLAVSKLLLKANGGTLCVRSGNGSVQTGATNREQHQELEVLGTLVALRARTDRPLNVQQVYRLLEDDFNDSLRDRGFDDNDF
jgi:anti-sigma regulatory factor (Ser/Thr protein kinase)/anti-anti-sigma regulatory factor